MPDPNNMDLTCLPTLLDSWPSIIIRYKILKTFTILLIYFFKKLILRTSQYPNTLSFGVFCRMISKKIFLSQTLTNKGAKGRFVIAVHFSIWEFYSRKWKDLENWLITNRNLLSHRQDASICCKTTRCQLPQHIHLDCGASHSKHGFCS